jgi:hypothetical protein
MKCRVTIVFANCNKQYDWWNLLSVAQQILLINILIVNTCKT